MLPYVTSNPIKKNFYQKKTCKKNLGRYSFRVLWGETSNALIKNFNGISTLLEIFFSQY